MDGAARRCAEQHGAAQELTGVRALARRRAAQRGQLRAGYAGHLTRIANKLASAAARRPPVAAALARHAAWQAYAARELASRNEARPWAAGARAPPGAARAAAGLSPQCSTAFQHLHAKAAMHCSCAHPGASRDALLLVFCQRAPSAQCIKTCTPPLYPIHIYNALQRTDGEGAARRSWRTWAAGRPGGRPCRGAMAAWTATAAPTSWPPASCAWPGWPRCVPRGSVRRLKGRRGARTPAPAWAAAAPPGRSELRAGRAGRDATNEGFVRT